MIQKDYHVHSEFSGDSDQNLEQLIQYAIKIGLQEIAITDHAEYGVENLPESFILPFSKYVKRIQEIQEKYQKEIKIRLGVEVGMYEKFTSYFQEQINAYPFDFIIGSNHSIEGQDIAFSSIFMGKEKQEVQEIYFETLWNNIQKFHDFSVVGHLDFVTRYGGNKFRGLNLRENWDRIQSILSYLIQNEKGIEINTSGFRYGEERFYPLPEIVKEYRRLGGEIITLGSDAHSKKFLTQDFKKVEDFLHSINYPYLASFEKRKAILEKI